MKDGGNGGGEVVKMPLDDLNIQWMTSTSGLNGQRDASASSSSEEAVEEPSSGPEGGEKVVGDEGGKKVAATPPVEHFAQPVMMEEGRNVVIPPEEIVIIEEVESNEGERGRVTGGEEREGPRSDEDTVMAEWSSDEVVGTSGGGDVGGEDPTGKKGNARGAGEGARTGGDFFG